jgi:hypothetical protein
MSQSEWFTTYLKYENLKDMLKLLRNTKDNKVEVIFLSCFLIVCNGCK